MVPKLTAEQRRAALDKGMQIRLKRAEYKARLKNGLMSIEQFFELADGGERARRRIKRLSVLVAVLIALLGCIIVFLCFCLMELFISIITGCLFSWLVPLLATAMVIMTYIALAIVRGGNCE